MQFSVLMSIYKKENAQNFDLALRSIWDTQTVKPNEIVLVEDGPLTPELYDVIAEWQRKLNTQLKVIKLDVNQGTGRAKQKGLYECSYDYIAIMDTDDVSFPTRFEIQINYFNNHPELAILGGQMEEFQEDHNHIVALRKVPTDYESIKQFAKHRSPFNNISVMYKKEIIQRVGGYQHHLYMEDYNLFLRVLAKGYKVENLATVLVKARINTSMFKRRRGFVYIKSEWQLARLKIQLNIQHSLHAYGLFFIRSLSRLFPGWCMPAIYFFLRK